MTASQNSKSLERIMHSFIVGLLQAPIATRLTILLLLGAAASTSAGEISDLFWKGRTNVVPTFDEQKSRTLTQVGSTNHGITEIGIERAGSVWGGPVYSFIARADGTFRYKGVEGVERTGDYSGTIPVGQFHELAQFIRDSGYIGFQEEYRIMATDLSSTYTTVVADSKRKVVHNYGNTGPTSLWAIENLIDHLMTNAKWKEELPRPPKPVLPSVTRYDSDPPLRLAYLTEYQNGYSDAWDRKESLPVLGPTTEVEKARVFGYSDGVLAGRLALAKWFGTNSVPANSTNAPVNKR
jgi:hypothetical protein